jgi:hypothetical protein
LKSKFELNQIKNTGVINQNFVQKVGSAILYLFSGKILTEKVHFSTEISSFSCPWIRIPNTDPDPQSH